MRRTLLVVALALAARPAAGQGRRELTDRGLDSLRQDVAIDSVDAQAYYRLGLGLWEKHRFDAADSAFQRALHFQPWHAGAHLALGILPAARGGRYLQDLPDRIGRDSLRAFFRAALRHLADAKVSDPRVDLSPLAFLNDDELIPSTTLGSGTIIFNGMRLSSYHDTPALKPMRRAMRALIEQRPDSAFDILAAALAARRADQVMNDQFIELYATSALRARHPDAAADGYRELAERADRREAAAHGSLPVDLGPLFNARGRYLLLYGAAEAEAGHRDVARAAFHEALLTDVTLYQAHAQLADLAESEGDLNDALAERQAAIAVSPEAARPYLDLGITLLQAGRAREAEDPLTEAAQRLPWDPGIELFLFQAAMATGDRVVAQHALEALDLFAPRRNHDQVAEAHQRYAQGAAP